MSMTEHPFVLAYDPETRVHCGFPSLGGRGSPTHTGAEPWEIAISERVTLSLDERVTLSLDERVTLSSDCSVTHETEWCGAT